MKPEISEEILTILINEIVKLKNIALPLRNIEDDFALMSIHTILLEIKNEK